MNDMVRKQIYLKHRQAKAVQKKAEALGINESELIRQAIDHDLFGSEAALNRPDLTAWDEIQAFLEAPSGISFASEPYLCKREDLYIERLNRLHGTDPD